MINDKCRCSSHLGLSTGSDGKPLQQLHDGQLYADESETHPDAVPGAHSERHVRVRINGLLVLLIEPEGMTRDSSKIHEIRKKISNYCYKVKWPI